MNKVREPNDVVHIKAIFSNLFHAHMQNGSHLLVSSITVEYAFVYPFTPSFYVNSSWQVVPEPVLHLDEHVIRLLEVILEGAKVAQRVVMLIKRPGQQLLVPRTHKQLEIVDQLLLGWLQVISFVNSSRVSTIVDCVEQLVPVSYFVG